MALTVLARERAVGTVAQGGPEPESPRLSDAEDASEDVLTKVLHRLESLERAVTKLSDALGEASPGHPLLLRDGSRDSARAITRDPSREPSRAPSPTPMARFERQRSISPNDQIAAAHLAAF